MRRNQSRSTATAGLVAGLEERAMAAESSPRAEQLDVAPRISSEAAAPKPLRLLACDRCHRRKIKCNRRFPCSNCIAVSSQCVQATPRRTQRRRRLPERGLQERLQQYESLLRHNNIEFEPCQPENAKVSSPAQNIASVAAPAGGDSEEKMSRAEISLKKHTPSRSDKLDIWHTADQKSHDAESRSTAPAADEYDFSRGEFTHDGTMQKALNHFHGDKKDHLLFFAPTPEFDLSPLHPGQAQLFKLWQVYLDNVNPLLKVTHTPTLQASIIDAVTNMENLDQGLEALMFGVYCASILSLTDHECLTIFHSQRADLMIRYQVGCQQALLKCGYLRTDDRNCLTALYLYVISIKSEVDRRSLCSMLGSVFRIAQRMGIHDESKNAKYTAFEAEMRRRLWWSLVIFDARVCENSNNFQSAMLIPTWDCKPPSNANDSEIRLEMKSLPPTSDVPTQALYIVVQSQISQYLRHSDFQLAFINPALKTLASQNQSVTLPLNRDELTALEEMIGTKYFNNCDPENPLHCITMYVARSQLAKARLLKHYWKFSRPGVHQTDAQRDAGTSHALKIIECEAELAASPHTKGFLWHVSRFYFPAYIHVLQDLKSRPTQTRADEAWRVISDDFKARFEGARLAGNPVFQLLSNIVIQAWEARNVAVRHLDSSIDLPWIVSDMKRIAMPAARSGDESDMPQTLSLNDLFPVPMDFDCQDLLDSMVMQPQVNDWNIALLGIDSSA